MLEHPHCKDCTFWDPEWRAPMTKRDPTVGACRRRAPTIANQGQPYNHWPEFPVVSAGFWCGDFSTRVDIAYKPEVTIIKVPDEDADVCDNCGYRDIFAATGSPLQVCDSCGYMRIPSASP